MKSHPLWVTLYISTQGDKEIYANKTNKHKFKQLNKSRKKLNMRNKYKQVDLNRKNKSKQVDFNLRNKYKQEDKRRNKFKRNYQVYKSISRGTIVGKRLKSTCLDLFFIVKSTCLYLFLIVNFFF